MRLYDEHESGRKQPRPTLFKLYNFQPLASGKNKKNQMKMIEYGEHVIPTDID